MSKGKREAESARASKPGRKAGKGKRIALIVLCCAAGLALAVTAAWFALVREPDVKDNDRPGVVNNNPNTPEGEKDSGISGRKDDYFTFLLIGRDTAGGGNTDTLILVSYDVPNGQVNMMSIPRDTAVNVPWSTKKINSVYNAKESNGGGLENLKKQVACLTGVMPDFYVIIEWKAVGEIVDAVDGVEFDVPRNMNYDDPYQNLHIHFNKGVQILDGQKAMELLRYRKDNRRADGSIPGYNDIGRMNTQRDFLKAMAKKVLQLGNITKIGDFVKIFLDNVETDLSLTDMMWFASKALSVDVDKMQSSTLPYIEVGTFRGGDYLLPNGEEIVPLVNEQFNPYSRDIELSDLQILVRNKDGSCYVTSGELLDAKWGKPTSSGSSGTAGGGVSTTEPTGVVADPVVDVPSNTGDPNQTIQQPADPVEPDSDPSSQETPGEVLDPDGTEAPGETSGPETEPGDTPEPPPPDEGTEPDPEPQPEPEPNPEPDPDQDLEPTLPPEPTPPPPEGEEIISAA